MSNASPHRSPSASRHTFSWFILIGANILWATSYVVSKYTLQELPFTTMLALRMCISALVLVPFLIVKRKELHLTRQDLPQLAILALIGFVINKLLEFGGLSLTTASDIALLITSESIFTAALAWILLHEPFKKRTGIALLLGFVGVYLIIERSFIPNIPAGGGAWRIVGDLLVILALLVEATYTIRGKILLKRHSPLLITSASIVGSVVVWLPIAGLSIFSASWHMPGIWTWLGIIWLAIMCTVIPYLAWFQALTKVEGSVAATTLFIQPLLGAVLAIVFLHDSLTPVTIIGGILIIISVYLIS